jgi:hypothetical protein
VLREQLRERRGLRVPRVLKELQVHRVDHKVLKEIQELKVHRVLRELKEDLKVHKELQTKT